MAFNGDYGGSGFFATKSLYYSDCFGFLRSVNIFAELLLYLYLFCYCYADGEKNFLLYYYSYLWEVVAGAFRIVNSYYFLF